MTQRNRARISLVALLVAIPFTARAEIVDRIVAVVEDELVLLSELERAKAPYVESLAAIENADARAEKEQALAEQVLEQLVDEILLEKQITALGIAVEDREVELAIEDILKRNSLDEDRLAMALAQQGQTLKEYKAEIRKQLSRLKLVNLRIKSQIKVSEEDIENYLVQHQPKEEVEVHAAHILFALPPDAVDTEVAQVNARAQEVLARSRAGEDFAALAREFSQGPTGQKGGDLGFFRRGQMVPEFEQVAFGMQKDQVSEPVRTQFGLHLIKVLEVRQVAQPAGPDRERVRQGLMQQQVERKLKAWLEELRQTSHIEYKL